MYPYYYLHVLHVSEVRVVYLARLPFHLHPCYQEYIIESIILTCTLYKVYAVETQNVRSDMTGKIQFTCHAYYVVLLYTMYLNVIFSAFRIISRYNSLSHLYNSLDIT